MRGAEYQMARSLFQQHEIEFGNECLRSMMFMQSLAEAREVGDSQKFTDAIAEYDSMTRLDGWKTQLLLRVKKRLTAVVEGEEEDLT